MLIDAHASDPVVARAAQVIARVGDLLDALHCGALLLTADGVIVHANPRVAQLLGRAASEIVGREFAALYPPDVQTEGPPGGAPCLTSECETEWFLPRHDGGRLPVVLSTRVPPGDSALAAYRVVTVLDISGQKAAEEQLREQYRHISTLSDTILEQALDLKHYSKTLEKRVQQRTRELDEANMEAIYMLAVASEAKDSDTGEHVLRIRDYARTLASAMGASESEAERIGYSAILHDVGKMQVPDDILKKPGPLNSDERRVIETHTIAGERILSNKPFFQIARQIARSHQENWDGTGYPDGLSGAAIPLAARIVRLADVFDALSSRRVYKEPWPIERVVDAILAGRGREFDPELVEAFQKLMDDGAWLDIRTRTPQM